MDEHLKSLLDIESRSDESIADEAKEILAGAMQALERSSALDRPRLLVALAQLITQQLVREHPVCPCCAIGSIAGWMAIVAANERFKHPFTCTTIVSPHQEAQ